MPTFARKRNVLIPIIVSNLVLIFAQPPGDEFGGFLGQLPQQRESPPGPYQSQLQEAELGHYDPQRAFQATHLQKPPPEQALPQPHVQYWHLPYEARSEMEDQVLFNALLSVLSTGTPAIAQTTQSSSSRSPWPVPSSFNSPNAPPNVQPHQSVEAGFGFASSLSASHALPSHLETSAAKAPTNSIRRNQHSEAESSHFPKRYSFVRKEGTEPEFLRTLEYTRPSVQQTRHDPFNYEPSSDEVRKLINERVFAGRLKWIDPKLVSKAAQKHHREEAFTLGRVLPFLKIDVRLPDRLSAYDVRMVSHGHNGHPSKWRKGTQFERKPYYAFWGIPHQRAVRPTRTVIQEHGLAYLDPVDFQDVNTHLEGLRALEQASKHDVHAPLDNTLSPSFLDSVRLSRAP